MDRGIATELCDLFNAAEFNEELFVAQPICCLWCSLIPASEPIFVLGEVSRAGDEFSDRPRVEAGWLSGRDLGRALADLA